MIPRRTALQRRRIRRSRTPVIRKPNCRAFRGLELPDSASSGEGVGVGLGVGAEVGRRRITDPSIDRKTRKP